MFDYGNYRLVDAIVNKTDQFFCMYEQNSGCKVRAYPDDLPFPQYRPESLSDSSGGVFCFIVTPEQLEQIRRDFPDRPLDDVGILIDVSPGRHDAPIGSVLWAKNPEVPVLFYHDANFCRSPHL